MNESTHGPVATNIALWFTILSPLIGLLMAFLGARFFGDNSRDFTHAAKVALEKTGRYVVGEENDPSKAHQTARSLKPDLILLDIAMPETDGGEVAAWIQADPALHRIPIVFLTALVTTAEGRAGLRIHGHPFLAKPISLPDLIQGIEENLPARAAF
jgi:two-component system, OmpR family, response regulator